MLAVRSHSELNRWTSAQLGHRGVLVVGEETERTAGVDGALLSPVAGEEDLRPGVAAALTSSSRAKVPARPASSMISNCPGRRRHRAISASNDCRRSRSRWALAESG